VRRCSKGAEFSPAYRVVVGTLEVERRSVQGADNHSSRCSSSPRSPC